MNRVEIPKEPIQCLNYCGGQWTEPSGSGFEVKSPYTGATIGSSKITSKTDLDKIVEKAEAGFNEWSLVPIKDRTAVMFRFRDQLLKNINEISHRVSSECGKTVAESKAGVMKGIEVLEFALSLQNLDSGGRMEVSRGVYCETRREPLGVVAGITPFNFPAMVPMWMLPIAITLGNSFLWKPSDKTPLTSLMIADMLSEAGLPPGVLSIAQGDKETVEAILDHPKVKAVGFVGSTNVAQAVYRRGTNNLKRVLALGGAKNHIILLPDADPELTGVGIANSFTGCAGQRCMAASVLLAVGPVDGLIEQIVAASNQVSLGENMGAIISKDSLSRIETAITQAEKSGAKLLLDGRGATAPEAYKGGYWLGPTIIDNVKPGSEAAVAELFGPVLSIIRCESIEEAMKIENNNEYGNACSIFTQNGGAAELVTSQARAGMVGVNIGVPVPREPFSFGGFYESRFGAGDITGRGGVDFWTQEKKVTSKWARQVDQNWMS